MIIKTSNSNSLTRLHLVKFIESFIKPEFSSRWFHFLVESPMKSSKELKKFERHLNESNCKLIESKEIESFRISHGNIEAVYFDGESDSTIMSVNESIEFSKRKSADSIISLSPGKEVIFIFHEGWGWHCTK